MVYSFSWSAFCVFAFFVAVVLGLSFYLGRKAKSAKGYYAAHGEIHWFVNGIAFAGDYLSAASFLGICGMIAFFGYDGFLYSIGYLAGWIVALFVIAEPIKRLGKFTFADALDSRFNSRGIKLAVAISTLVVSIFYLIPQMVGAGALVKPLLGIRSEYGIMIVGFTVIIIVVTAGMVSTTWVQFIKGSLLVIFCFVLTVMILQRGLKVVPLKTTKLELGTIHEYEQNIGGTTIVHRLKAAPIDGVDTQSLTVTPDGKVLVNWKPQSKENDLKPFGTVSALPGGKMATGPLGPVEFISTLQNSTIVTVGKMINKEPDGSVTTMFYPQ